MKKEQIFENMHLVPEGLIELDDYLTRPGGIFHEPHVAEFELTSDDGGEWQFSSFVHFLAEYEPLLTALYQRRRPDCRVTIFNCDDSRYVHSRVTVIAEDSQTIDDIFNIIEKYRVVSLFPPLDPAEDNFETQGPMRKTQTFRHLHLVRQGLKELDQYLTCQGGIFGDPHSSLFEIVYPHGSRREFDKSPAFLAEYYPLFYARYHRSRPGFEINLDNFDDSRDLYSRVTVLAQDRQTIHDIFNIIEKYRTQSLFFPAHPKESARNLFAAQKTAI